MSAARRTASTRLTRLAAKASPYHGAVTLYEASEVVEAEGDEGQTGPSDTRSRRPTRRRVKHESVDGDALELGLDVPSESTSKQGARHDVARKTKPAPRRGIKAKTEISIKTETDALDSDAKKSPKSKSKSKSRSKSKAVLQPLDVPHPAPAKWAEVYAAIKEMRSRVVAPVDTMGCDQAQFGEQDPKNRRFATLVSLMLSSQTKDEVTDAAVAKLRAALGGSLSVQAVLEADETVISEAIAKVGFWRRKTQYIKQTAKRLQDDFDADVPKTADELCSLPGVGPKMAFLALQVAWNLNLGIGVDVHVHRITNRLGWHARPTKNPEETRLNLESWLPKALHGEINHLLVGFGQTICLPVGPKCSDCTLSAAGLCPSAQTAKSRTKSSKVVRKWSGTSSGEGDVEEGSGPKVKIELELPRDGGAGPAEET